MTIMAVFQLGAIVTGIVGSIGGTTFKRQGSSLVIQRKSGGASRSSTLQNIRLGQNALIFRSWNNLPPEDKLAWENIALNTKVKNKFGEDVNVSGVSFQRKCQLQLAPINTNEIDPDSFNTTLSSIDITTTFIDWIGSDFSIQGTVEEDQAHCIFYIEFSLQNLNAPNYNPGGSFAIRDLDNNFDLNLFNPLLEKYPFLNQNYNFRLYYKIVNNSGWSTPLFMKEIPYG